MLINKRDKNMANIQILTSSLPNLIRELKEQGLYIESYDYIFGKGSCYLVWRPRLNFLHRFIGFGLLLEIDARPRHISYVTIIYDNFDSKRVHFSSVRKMLDILETYRIMEYYNAKD